MKSEVPDNFCKKTENVVQLSTECCAKDLAFGPANLIHAAGHRKPHRIPWEDLSRVRDPIFQFNSRRMLWRFENSKFGNIFDYPLNDSSIDFGNEG